MKSGKTHIDSWQGVYKGVRAWSRRTLEKAGERVMDVTSNDENDEDDDVSEAEGAAGPSTEEHAAS